MTVDVKTADLKGYAGQLKRNADHTDKVLEYVKEWCGQELRAVDAEGLFAKGLDFHDKAYDSVVQMISHLGRIVRGSASELENAAKFYDKADDASRERIDKLNVALTETARDGWEKDVKGYNDAKDPNASLNTPHEEDVDDMTKVLDAITDLTSITGIALKIVEILTGRKPLEEAMQFLTGDWEAFSRAGAAWKNVGQALADIGENLDRGNASMDHGWEGEASESAYRMFQSIADVFKQLQEPFNKLAEAYKAYAKFAYITASVIADLIKQLSDLAFAYLTRTKGGAFAEAFAVFHAMKIVKLVGKFGLTLIAARGTVGVYFGGLSFVGAPLFGLGPGLREKGYDLQGV